MDTGLDALKNTFKRVVYKAAEATCEFTRNKIAGKIVKLKHVIDLNLNNVEEIIISPEKREEILKKLMQVL